MYLPVLPAVFLKTSKDRQITAGITQNPTETCKKTIFSFTILSQHSCSNTHATQPKRKGNLDLGNKTGTQQI